MDTNNANNTLQNAGGLGNAYTLGSRPAPDWHDIVSYHAPSPEGLEAIQKIRDATENLIRTIAENTPRCADQSAAIRKAREAMMTANAAVVLDGAV
jgi:hypothetical protein